MSLDIYREQLEAETRGSASSARLAMSDDIAYGDVADGAGVRAGSKHGYGDSEIYPRRHNPGADKVYRAHVQGWCR